MKNIRSILIVSFLLVIVQLQAQDSLPKYKSEKFRSLEVKTGLGFGYPPRLYLIPVNIVYQQNIKRGFSTILFSEVLPFFWSTSKVSYGEFIWTEAIGIGRTIGNNRFNNGLYLLGGGRFYHTKVVLYNTDFNQNTLVTNKITPELGILYNLKVGRKKFYFTTQIYLSLYPIQNFIESRHTLTLGVGYRLNNRK
jgi:hypothetical protein